MLRFDQFMDRALHDPEKGYYARRITGVGRRGDFTTAPTLSSAPAKAIASWAAAAMKECSTRHLIEIGPGEGVLASAVLKHLPLALRWRAKLHLIETSAPLTEIQRRLLGNRAVWHRDPSSALAACGGNAVIYSNELVDAFPVRRFENTLGGWQEIAVDLPSRKEILLPSPQLPDSSIFHSARSIGQRVEVHESYHHWLGGWLPLWKSGRMLTIDYGATSENLCHRRPSGTVRAYLLQQRIEGPGIYENMGRQDLTADVNFTDLIRWTGDTCTDHKLRTFGEFISPFLNEDPAGKQLADPGGAGGAFLVLDQKRA